MLYHKVFQREKPFLQVAELQQKILRMLRKDWQLLKPKVAQVQKVIL